MGKLDGKVAIISGGSSGIGYATAKVFAEEGADVVIFSRTEKIEIAAQKLKDLGYENILAMRADASKNEDWDRIIDATLKRFGKIDILFTNAGGYVKPENQMGSMWTDQFTEEGWRDQFEQNFWSQLRAVRKCLPEITKAKGNIVMMGSVTVVSSSTPACGYQCAKAATTTFARDLANQIGHTGVRVNVIHPGFVRSSLTSFAEDEESEMTKKVKAAVRIGNDLGYPEDIGHAVAFLASDDARYITGTELVCDGGYKFL